MFHRGLLLWLMVVDMDTEGTEGTEEGGNLLPYLVGGMVALDTIQFLYGAYQNFQRMKENERYWSDYYDNTGIEPLYPYRAGSYNDYLGTALDVNQGVVSLYKKYRG